MHSVLFRIYNLLDTRFSMLVLCIKYIIKEIGLKTISSETSFLNSFSWEMLIKAFLQDIIKPPILPKLIENSDQNKLSVYSKVIRFMLIIRKKKKDLKILLEYLNRRLYKIKNLGIISERNIEDSMRKKE